MFTPIAWAAILPELLLLALAILILIIEPFWKEEDRRRLGWVSAVGFAVTAVVSLIFANPGARSGEALGGMVRVDWLGFSFTIMFLFAGAVTSLFLMDHEKVYRRGEAYILLIASVIGMSLMVSAADLVMLYLAIETTSIPLYVLAGFMIGDAKSTEAGFKYLLFGAFTSAILLYAFSLLFGLSGTTSLAGLAASISSGSIPMLACLGLLGLVLVGLGFKIAVVPFHFWAPDVYEGAPTPIAGFLSTASKAAGFAVLARFLLTALPALSVDWSVAVAILSAVSMTAGNLLALPQRNVKRLLAYSSISHAGYALVGIVAAGELGIGSVVFYMMAYIATNLAAFGIVMVVGRVTQSDEFDAYRGLSRRAPWLSLAMLAAFLSLAGMPPFGGFVAKVLVFAAGMQTGYTWLVVIGILNSVVGIYYYLNLMKYVYLFRMDNSDEDRRPIAMTWPHGVATAILAAAVIVLGTVFAPWLGIATAAARSLF